MNVFLVTFASFGATHFRRRFSSASSKQPRLLLMAGRQPCNFSSECGRRKKNGKKHFFETENLCQVPVLNFGQMADASTLRILGRFTTQFYNRFLLPPE